MRLKLLFIAFVIGVFLLGWKTNEFLSDIGDINLENPLSEGFFTAREINSPHDHIKKDQIHVYSDRVVIDIENPMWAEFTDTNSMDPLFDETSNSVEIKPKTIMDLHVGDVVAYKPKNFQGLVIHRITEIGLDNDGWYCLAKGDNLSSVDPEKIRFEQVHSVLVAIIY